ncbi:AEC family transporter [Sedimentibacter sp. MB31-C6]|uniref:AEC family transporter n=1 Tax=Sedimentibacter sp. MB31-C6 TaxID=3109366 RepID=UPI002DDD3C97|nr:AEC family transporter [Sedimentibacter sp. MB36-C1]WSI03303.1 AEC family transporter [Sedimentibacter sp. MB36-C1]
MDITIVFNNIATLFLLIFIGLFAGKTEMVNKNATGYLSDVLMKITLPATIFLSISGTFSQGILKDSLVILIITFMIHISCILISLGYTKLIKIPDKDRGVWIFTSTFTNVGFMGFPIIYAILGKEGLFLASISNTVFNILIFSIGVKMITMGFKSESNVSVKKLLLNNNNIAIVLGIFFYLAQISLPEFLYNSINHIGSATTPLSMILVGLSISKNNMSDIFNDNKLYILSIVRLLIIPFLVLIIMKIIPFESTSLIPKVMVIAFAMPAPSVTSIIAEQYNGNKELAAKVVFLTSVVSMLTIPIVLLLI